MREIFVENKRGPINFSPATKYPNNSTILFSCANTSRGISIELSPNRSLETNEIENLSPVFCSVVWCRQLSDTFRDVSKIAAISLSKQLSFRGNCVLLHLVGRHLNESQVICILNQLQGINVRNIFVLQGEASPEQTDKFNFRYASDLVKFIKLNYGNYFCIGVAGYPEMHPQSLNKSDDLKYLKLKVDSGADFIITQMFFNSETFSRFYKECRGIGITVPIIPGICIMNSYESLTSMVTFCKVRLPEDVAKILLENKKNPEAIRNYGIFHCSQLIRELYSNKDLSVLDIHFFCLNNIELVRNICKRLSLCDMYIERPMSNNEL